jgi:hypothetical protein
MANATHKCKCHDKPYTTCAICRCEYCPDSWATCPRCAEIKRVAAVEVPGGLLMGAARSDGWLHSVMSGTCYPVEPKFLVGDEVDVLRACRLPSVEEVTASGRIERITESSTGETLHWVSGVSVAKTIREIRLVRRGRLSDDNHLLVRPRKTLAEAWAEEDEQRHEAGE